MKKASQILCGLIVGCLFVLVFTQCMLFEDEKTWMDDQKDNLEERCNDAIERWYVTCDYTVAGLDGWDALADCVAGGEIVDWTCYLYCYEYPVTNCDDYSECVDRCQVGSADDDDEGNDDDDFWSDDDW